MSDLFAGVGMLIGRVLYVTPREAFALCGKGCVLIDIRPEYETAGKRIIVKSIAYIPWEEFPENYSMLDTDRYFIVMDEVGLHSKEIAEFMLEQGFQHAASMSGGIVDWERDGLPVDIDKGELMTGSCACTLKPKKRFIKD
jgi:rhodanese-related sulfurtransferase